jgi:hypothetical protein
MLCYEIYILKKRKKGDNRGKRRDRGYEEEDRHS